MSAQHLQGTPCWVKSGSTWHFSVDAAANDGTFSDVAGAQQRPTPCWTVTCDGCGKPYVDLITRDQVHFETLAAAWNAAANIDGPVHYNAELAMYVCAGCEDYLAEEISDRPRRTHKITQPGVTEVPGQMQLPVKLAPAVPR
jgi:hypothetical protein